MNNAELNGLKRVLAMYEGDHDLGPQAPVTWREMNIAVATLALHNEVETLKAQVAALLAAVPSANKKAG